MNLHPAGWYQILLQFFSGRIELFQLSSSKAPAACNMGSSSTFLFWLLDLSQTKILETAILKQPGSHKAKLSSEEKEEMEWQDWTYFIQIPSKICIFPAFFIQISMVKESIIHQRMNSVLCFRVSYLFTFILSRSLYSHQKPILHFHVPSLAVLLLGLVIAWATVLFFFPLFILVKIVCVSLSLSSALFLTTQTDLWLM